MKEASSMLSHADASVVTRRKSCTNTRRPNYTEVEAAVDIHSKKKQAHVCDKAPHFSKRRVRWFAFDGMRLFYARVFFGRQIIRFGEPPALRRTMQEACPRNRLREKREEKT